MARRTDDSTSPQISARSSKIESSWSWKASRMTVTVGGEGDQQGPDGERVVNSRASTPRRRERPVTACVRFRREPHDAGLSGRADRGRRRRRRRPGLAASASDSSAEAAPAEEPVLPAGVATVLSVLRSSAVVVDDDDEVRQGLGARPRARPGTEPATGRRPSWPSSSARYAATARSARPTCVLPRRNGPPRTVTARVAPLSSRLVLALVEDRTRERRVESVRRDFVANVSHELKTPGRRDPAPRRGGRRRRPTTPRRSSASPADAHRERPAARRWCSRSSSCPGSRATSRSRQPAVVDVDAVIEKSIDVTVMDATTRTSRSSPAGRPGSGSSATRSRSRPP